MTRESRLINKLNPNPLGNNNFVLPNTSGDHVRSIKRSVPVEDADLANKKYVDDNIGGGPVEGVDVLSTGEGGASKFLREDGDDSCSWQTVPGSAAPKLNEIDDPDANTAISMGSNNLKFQFSNPASDGFNIEGIGAFSGDLFHVHQHTGNPGAVNLVSLHAVDTDVTPIYVENAGGEIFKIDNSGNLTLDGTVDGVDIAARDHAESHTVASHSDTTGTGGELDTLTDNSMADTLHRHSELSASDGTPDAALSLDASGVPTHTTDMDSNDTLFIPNIWHGTDGTPPAANTCPRGTLYVQYTA